MQNLEQSDFVVIVGVDYENSVWLFVDRFPVFCVVVVVVVVVAVVEVEIEIGIEIEIEIEIGIGIELGVVVELVDLVGKPSVSILLLENEVGRFCLSMKKTKKIHLKVFLCGEVLLLIEQQFVAIVVEMKVVVGFVMVVFVVLVVVWLEEHLQKISELVVKRCLALVLDLVLVLMSLK